MRSLNHTKNLAFLVGQKYNSKIVLVTHADCWKQFFCRIFCNSLFQISNFFDINSWFNSLTGITFCEAKWTWQCRDYVPKCDLLAVWLKRNWRNHVFSLIYEIKFIIIIIIFQHKKYTRFTTSLTSFFFFLFRPKHFLED